MGPDLEYVAEYHRMTVEQVIDLHQSANYRVLAIGFMPGFPYLGGMSPKIRTPRLPTPRVCVAAGSVGIGGAQTGIYPLASPGGWRLIGRTPATLFFPSKSPPVLFAVGDTVRFIPISCQDFAAYEDQA